MKRLMLLVAMIAVVLMAKAQNPFEKAINEGLAILDSAKSITDIQSAVNKFERISMVETTRWESFYYAAYSQVNLSFWEKDGDKKDQILDQAEKNIDKALSLNGDKSELYALLGFLYQGRIQVSPMRGMTYSQKAADILGQAIDANPENPRALFLMAQNIYYTPKMFGGGAKNALPKYQAAKSKFDKENSREGVSPRWGAKMNSKMIDACTKDS